MIFATRIITQKIPERNLPDIFCAAGRKIRPTEHQRERAVAWKKAFVLSAACRCFAQAGASAASPRRRCPTICGAWEGLWVDAGLCGSRFIGAEAIEVLGEVSVTVDAPGQRRRMREKALFRRVITTGGARLGAVVDAAVDAMTFQVAGLIVSTGYWDDLVRGRLMIRHFAASPEGEVIADLHAGEEEHNEERHD